TAVLLHLHRILKPGGVQFCIIPFMKGASSEDLGDLTDEERYTRFGQSDHVRRFGSVDALRTIGMVFKLPDPYDIEPLFGADVLLSHAIPKAAWSGYTYNTVLTIRKEDCLLT